MKYENNISNKFAKILNYITKNVKAVSLKMLIYINLNVIVTHLIHNK
jgi:hypothetical protein